MTDKTFQYISDTLRALRKTIDKLNAQTDSSTNTQIEFISNAIDDSCMNIKIDLTSNAITDSPTNDNIATPNISIVTPSTLTSFATTIDIPTTNITSPLPINYTTTLYTPTTATPFTATPTTTIPTANPTTTTAIAYQERMWTALMRSGVGQSRIKLNGDSWRKAKKRKK